MTREILAFAFPGYERLIPKQVMGLPCATAPFSLTRFANNELQCSLLTSVAGRSCLIVGSISPPDTNLLTFLLLSHTLKKEGAKSITAFVPYLAYSRQENDEPHKSQATALLGQLIKAAGINTLITVDIHSPLVQTLFPIRLRSVSPSPLFAEALQQFHWPSYTIVAPDRGAITRCQDLSALIEMPDSPVWISKVRHTKGVSHLEVSGTVHERVVIVDDILDTGQTMVSCCQRLAQEGAQEMVVMVTHGLFTGAAWKKLWKLGVEKIYCTDTVPLARSLHKEPRISILPITHLGDGIWKN